MPGICSRQGKKDENSLLKLLFDQNISPRIVRHLASTFKYSKQVRQVGLEDASDDNIFEYAKANGFSIVTFDSDFVDLNTMRGIPPKVIWLRTGNLITKSIAELLNQHLGTIVDFLGDEVDEILEISSQK